MKTTTTLIKIPLLSSKNSRLPSIVAVPQIKFIRVSFGLTFLIFCFTSICLSQTISQAKYSHEDGTVEIQFNPKVPKDQIQSITVFNTVTGKTEVFKDNAIVQQGPIGLLTYAITPGTSVMPTDIKTRPNALKSIPIILAALIKKPDGEMIAVSARISEVGSDSRTIVNVEAEGRDDAVLYIEGGINAARKQKPEFTADIKYESLRQLGNLPARWSPFLTFKASSIEEADPDELRFGVKFTNHFGFNPNSTTSASEAKKRTRSEGRARNETGNHVFRWEGTAEIESDRAFRVTNFLTSQRLKYLLRSKMLREPPTPPNTEGTPRGRITLTPFIGTELGRNLKTPFEREERGIARVLYGGTLVLKLFNGVKLVGIEQINWENSFIQRHPLLKEISYDKDDDGKLKLVELGRKPRGHFSSKLTLNINEFFGPTLSYEWGSLPPLYNKIDHQLKLGFTYAFKRGEP